MNLKGTHSDKGPGSVHRGTCMLSLLFVLSCQLNPLAGGEMSGPERSVDTFDFASQFALLRLETRPNNPYAVNLRVTVIEGELYVDSATGRRWGKFLADDPNVRIRLGKTIYPARAEQILDKDIVERFPQGRHIYRMEPRSL